ncbi:MAG: transposase [Caulobacteraceae bacterium]|nr:transposase [Caulobacteraceae bacterium]
MDPDARRAIRQENSRPLIEALEPWMRATLETISQKTKLAEAIRLPAVSLGGPQSLPRGRPHRRQQHRRALHRPLALTRKNSLFAGSEGGAEHWAILASLIETAKLNEINPQAYITDVITRIVGGHPQRQMDQLMPWR